MSRLVGVLGLVFFGMVIVDVSAQEARPVEKGPTEKETVAFSVDLIGELTDNRDSLPDKESNVDLIVRPRIDLAPRWPTTTLDFYYAPSWRYRSNPSDLQNDTQIFHDLALNLQHDARLVRLMLNEYFCVVDDPSVQRNGVTQREDCSYMMERADVGAAWKFTKRTELGMGVRGSMKRYNTKGIAELSDEDSYGGTVTLWHQFQRTTGFLLAGDMAGYSYNDVGNADRDFTMSSGTAGLEHDFLKDLRGSAKVGFQVVEYKNSALDSKNGMTVSASIHGASTPAVRMTGAASYGIKDSAVYPFATQTATELMADVAWDVAPERVTLRAMGAYALGKYNTDTISETILASSPGTYHNGDQTTVVGSAGVVYKIDLETSISLVERYERVSSDVRDPYTKNSVSVILTAKF